MYRCLLKAWRADMLLRLAAGIFLAVVLTTAVYITDATDTLREAGPEGYALVLMNLEMPLLDDHATARRHPPPTLLSWPLAQGRTIGQRGSPWPRSCRCLTAWTSPSAYTTWLATRRCTCSCSTASASRRPARWARPGQVQAALARGDRGEACCLVHTLRCLAGSLGECSVNGL